MPVSIEVEEKKLKICKHKSSMYATDSKRLESHTLQLDNQGFGKLQLNLFPYDTKLKIMVSAIKYTSIYTKNTIITCYYMFSRYMFLSGLVDRWNEILKIRKKINHELLSKSKLMTVLDITINTKIQGRGRSRK